MKKSTLISSSKGHSPILRLMLSMILAVFSLLANATSKEYAASEASTLVSEIEAGAYDEYILNESGGLYDLKDIDIATSAIIKAKDGLAEKPMMIYTGKNTSAYTAFFDLGATDLSITLQGILFDGATDSLSMMGVTRIDMSNCNIQMIDCEVKNFTSSNGFVRVDKVGATLSIQDSYVHDCYGRLIRINNNGDAMGDISLENCTFANITDDPVIHWVSSASSTVPSISINQCTFYNINDNVFKLGAVTNCVSVTNCNFDSISAAIETLATNSITMDYSYGGFGGPLPTNVVLSNAITTAPLYTNVKTMDLTLTNAGDLLGSDGQTIIGDSRWYPAMSLPTAPNEYAAADVDSLVSHMERGLYSEYILTEAGGVYDLKDIDIATDAVLKAKDGLEAMPTIIYTGKNSSAYTSFLDLAANDLNITLQGIIFGGATDSLPMMGVTRIDKTNCKITMIDCEIKNFSTSNGFVRIGAAGATFTIEDSYVHDCYGRLIRIDNTGDVFGDLTIDNCTFANISNDPVIHWVSSATSTVPSININQSTFYNVNDNVFKIGTVTNGVKVTNCNFDAVSKAIDNAMSSSVTLDYCYAGFGEALVETVTEMNAVTTAPEYSNAPELDLKLLNENDILGSDAQTPIGDSRWTTAASIDVLEILYGEQILTDEAGQEAVVKSSISFGDVYLVLDGEPQSTLAEMDVAVASNKGVKDTVTAAYTDVALSVAGLTNGIYYAYAVQNADNISEKGSNTITVLPGLNVQNKEQSVPNSTGSTVEASASKDGFIYVVMEGDYTSVAALDAAVNGKRGAKVVCTANSLVAIGVTGIRAGTYYAYAVDGDANVSARGLNPIYITTSVYVEYEAQVASNKEGPWAFAYVSAGTPGGVAYIVNSTITADVTVTEQLLNDAVASMNADSMMVSEEKVDYKVSTSNLVPGTYHFYLVKDGMVSEEGSAVVTVRKPNTYYYSADQVEEMRMALYTKEITTGDEVVLTTSGGHYGFKTYFRVYGGITFRAQDGLAEKPVLSYDPDAHGEAHRSYMRLMEFYPPAGKMHIKGIEFDGGASDESINNDGTCIFEPRYNATFNYPYSIVYEDCYIHDFNTINTNSSGSSSQDGYIFRQRANVYADSIVFDNCVISDTYKAAFNFISGSDYAYFGEFLVKNSTLTGTNGLIALTSPDMAQSTIRIEHCTIDSIGMDNSDSRLILPDALDGLMMSNSIVTNSASTVVGDSALVLGVGSSVSHTAFYNVANIVDGVQNSVSTDKDPQYYNPMGFNFAVQNAELLTVASDNGQVGDPRWSATDDFAVETEMIAASGSVLILYFNQPFDTAAAKVSTNYTLSGSYGATGNPISVALFAPNAVKLTLADFSDGQDFQTITATVNNVINVNANNLQSGMDAATYTFPILANMDEQTVGNEDGQYVLASCGSTNGFVYLIPALEAENIIVPEQLEALVEAGVAASAMVTTSGEMAQIAVGGMTPGLYYAYAVNDIGDKMSVRSSNAVTIVGLEATMGLQFNITNAPGQVVKAQSSYLDAQIYLAVDDSNIVEIEDKADLIEAVDSGYAVVSDVAAPFVDVEINVEGIYATESGVRYRAYTVAGDSVSAASKGAVIITAAPNALNEVLGEEVKVFASQGWLTIELSKSSSATVKVFDLGGLEVKAFDMQSSSVTFEMPRTIYIVQLETKNGRVSMKIVN